MFRAEFNTGNEHLDKLLNGRPAVDAAFEMIVGSHFEAFYGHNTPMQHVARAEVVPVVLPNNVPSFVITPYKKVHDRVKRMANFAVDVCQNIDSTNKFIYGVEEEGRILVSDLGEYTKAFFSIIIMIDQQEHFAPQ